MAKAVAERGCLVRAKPRKPRWGTASNRTKHGCLNPVGARFATSTVSRPPSACIRLFRKLRPQSYIGNCCHGLDRYYNFFARSAWSPAVLAQRVGLLILTALRFTGLVT